MAQNGRPLAVVEAKRETIDPYAAKQQTLPYAQQLEAPFPDNANGISKYRKAFDKYRLYPYCRIEEALGIEPTKAFQGVAWACWVPNLIVAEMINIFRQKMEGRQTARGTEPA